ncbi:MAG: hypothetical protein EHM72_19290 [Calditrichaeota bacterium]|nr:MAG: hypothetical protein EHM72_19290 [Calditrichota bacterium]
MRAAILHGAHDFRIEERPTPEIKASECLIQVHACGVCHSEIHQWRYKLDGLDYPRFIGHEVAGRVIAVGENITKVKPGDRVAVWTDGKGYAEQVAVSADYIFPLADDIPFSQAMAEPIACTTNGVNRAGIQLGDVVVIVGVGFMGLILLQQVRLCGALQVIAVDIRDEMLTLAEDLGADVTINPQRENALNVIKSLSGGRGADVVFEAGGSQETLNLAAQLCRMEGKLVLFGYHPGARTINDLGYWNWMAFDIINAHFRNIHTILNGARVGINLLNAHLLNLQPLITHEFMLDDIEAAFQAAYDKPPGFVKSVLLMNE